MVFKQEVNIPLALTIGLISGLLLLIMTFGVQAWYESAEEAEAASKAFEAPKSEFVQLKADQAENIKSYGWADATRTNVKIPITIAMERMVQTNGKLPKPAATQPSTKPSAATQPTASADVTR